MQPTCSERTNSITYCECVLVALGTQHAMSMGHIVFRGLHRSTIFSHIISLTAQYSEKNLIEYKTCVLIFSTNFVRNIFHSKNNFATYDSKCTFGFMYSTVIVQYIGLHVQYRYCTVYRFSCTVPLFLSDFNKI